MSEDAKLKAIETLLRIAEEKGVVSVPRHEFVAKSGVSERRIVLLFGSYNGFVEAAGLVPRFVPTAGKLRYSNEDLIAEVVRILSLPGARPTARFFEQNSAISNSTVMHRFGGWENSLRVVSESLDRSTDAEVRTLIEGHLGKAGGRDRSTSEDPSNEPTTPRQPAGSGHPQIEGTRSPIYGDFLNFRGLQHAPVNEQGVVFLFGMICLELGYIVEAVRQGFPDCEAKRQISGTPARWQRVRIEFEFKSRNFKAHGHDAGECDVVVCWKHDWPECPLEVLELRSVLEELEP